MTPERLVELIRLVEEGAISNNIAKKILREVFETGKSPAEIVAEKGLEQQSDEGALLAVVHEVIQENPGPAEDYRMGAQKAIGFLMGQVMKKTQGKANPQIVKPLLEKELGAGGSASSSS
jgi:aspartyl-tRNA(Asn)/glutamyl-tRNA(Gln) amidotransferase subunit B